MQSKMTKLFFDTEFTGLHQKTTLISIGIVAESGETFYAELTDYDKSQCDAWINENVIKNLILTDKIKVSNSSWENWISDSGVYGDAIDFSLANKNMKNFECIGPIEMVKNRLEKWLSQFEAIQMWSDCLSYDWVLFCNVWGHAFSVPKNVYYIPFDICPLLLQKTGDADISREWYIGGEVDMEVPEIWRKLNKHNSLWDAYVIRECYNKLNS